MNEYSVVIQFLTAYAMGFFSGIHRLVFPIFAGLYFVFVIIGYVLYPVDMNSSLIEGLSLWRLAISAVGLICGYETIKWVKNLK